MYGEVEVESMLEEMPQGGVGVVVLPYRLGPHCGELFHRVRKKLPDAKFNQSRRMISFEGRSVLLTAEDAPVESVMGLELSAVDVSRVVESDLTRELKTRLR
jgi:hypothetical protein